MRLTQRSHAKNKQLNILKLIYIDKEIATTLNTHSVVDTLNLIFVNSLERGILVRKRLFGRHSDHPLVRILPDLNVFKICGQAPLFIVEIMFYHS